MKKSLGGIFVVIRYMLTTIPTNAIEPLPDQITLNRQYQDETIRFSPNQDPWNPTLLRFILTSCGRPQVLSMMLGSAFG